MRHDQCGANKKYINHHPKREVFTLLSPQFSHYQSVANQIDGKMENIGAIGNRTHILQKATFKNTRDV